MSPHPRTTGPPTWPTRHGEAGLTQAWRGQRSYGRPNTGKVGKVDIPQLQARASPQGSQTACSKSVRGRDRYMEEVTTQKHFVLVHGFGHGAWCWYKLVVLLRLAGHRVTTLDLAASGVHPQRLDELESFADYSRPLTELMAAIPPHERVVLVGHSYGGVSLALAMEKFAEKILVAVFATALMPSPSNSDIELATVLLRPGRFFSYDLSNNMVLTEANYGSVRRAFIVCKQDKAMVEDYQRWLIERSPGAEVKEIDGADHMVMLSKPRELCNLLLEIADEYK
ncbi:hypothetical protein B296_00017725 [Ensete ventricosum]|uniref:AB hydrolase-1 domain-containing protein n=1 Tax=Ensete ventricosum TaxID=4639 RepID=A0A427B4M7_ENSVE|nr:hypothetical protein B296_00017725 [Ensete ventricosum]